MAKQEKPPSPDVDITELHHEPNPEDVVLPTDEAVAKMKEASKLNLPKSSEPRPSGGTPDRTRRRQRNAPASAPAAQPKQTQQPGTPAAQPAAGTAAKQNQPAAQPAAQQPPAPKLERAKNPEEKATAYTNYFKDIKTHGEFLKKILEMSADPTLQQVVGVTELEKTATAAHQLVFTWATVFQAQKNTINPLILVEFAEKTSKKLPEGFRSTLHRIVLNELVSKEQEKAKQATPEPAQATPEQKISSAEAIPDESAAELKAAVERAFGEPEKGPEVPELTADHILALDGAVLAAAAAGLSEPVLADAIDELGEAVETKVRGSLTEARKEKFDKQLLLQLFTSDVAAKKARQEFAKAVAKVQANK